MASPLDPSAAPNPSRRSPYTVLLRLALGPLVVYFKNPGYIMKETMDMIDSRALKNTLKRTHDSQEVREALAADLELWHDLGEVFEAAVPSLEKRSFAAPDPVAPEYEGASGTLIASHCTSLLKDIERLNDLVAIGRNVLSLGDTAQNLAAKEHVDMAIFKLISVCVKVTARGYDGDAGTTDEEKWQLVVNQYKKLLITSLQFLNNLVAQNERRKLMLWVELFDSSTDGVLSQYPGEIPPEGRVGEQVIARGPPAAQEEEKRQSAPSHHISKEHSTPTLDATREWREDDPEASPFLLFIGKEGMMVKQQLTERGEKAGAKEIAAECRRRYDRMSPAEKADWKQQYDFILKSKSPSSEPLTPEQEQRNRENAAVLRNTINQLQSEVNKLKASVDAKRAPRHPPIDHRQTSIPSKLMPVPKPENWDTDFEGTSTDFKAYVSLGDSNYMPITAEVPEPPPATESDFRMQFNAAQGADILRKGKEDLMKRLETYPEPRNTMAEGRHRLTREELEESPLALPTEERDDAPRPPDMPDSELEPELLSDEYSEEQDSEDDYVVPGDDGRGLLTDVPLILGPTEIEVLPMVIMSGIVPPQPSQPGYGSTPEEVTAIKNMHTVRCHLLLAQDNGRNLLRELLIFVAAWDLREEELYFRFMVKIMEAILQNGLMPFSYHSFRESKDIISPAQAVIMKLLTAIFRSRQVKPGSTPILSTSDAKAPTDPHVPLKPPRVDVHLINFLFTEFRKHIIPQTCALIFLQGQIRCGLASPEDFPLNLWDMERMYEGVYQYLEFFAILTEGEVWKNMMAEGELTSELVTLIRELSEAVPLRTIKAQGQAREVRDMQRKMRELEKKMDAAPNAESSAAIISQALALAPVAVERPYDINSPSPSAGSTDPGTATPYHPPPLASEDEPSAFEWRNLKKLAVLVLSSLLWKSPLVQKQLREHGGIEALLNCTMYDEWNPYIREHAIMALRFALEGCRENQDVVRRLESMEKVSVPSEVLDLHGYETFVDGKGQVKLVRREAPAQTGAGAGATVGRKDRMKGRSDVADLSQMMQAVLKGGFGNGAGASK